MKAHVRAPGTDVAAGGRQPLAGSLRGPDGRLTDALTRAPAAILALQRTAGNAAVGELLAQRQDAGTSPAANAPMSFTQTGALFQQALPGVAGLDATIHGYLVRAQYATPSTVRTEPIPGLGSVRFRLMTAQAPIDPRVAALFQGGAVDMQQGPPVVVTISMTMAISGQLRDASRLTQALFHEGMHMVLFMDTSLQKLQIPVPPSPLSTGRASYLGWFQGASSYPALRSELMAVYAHPPSGTPESQAGEVIDHLVEEKFVYDQQAVRSGQATDNAVLARQYIRADLDADHIALPDSSQRFRTLVSLAIQCFAAVDTQRRARQATPAPRQP